MLKSFMKLGTSFALLMATATVANAQCKTWDAYPDGVEEAKTQHVAYRIKIEKKDYKGAFEIWSKLFEHVQAPTVMFKGKEKKISLHYQDGIQMYKEFAQGEQDATKKKEYLDKMMDVYEQMATCLGEKSIDRAYQGYYLWYLQGDSRKVVELFEKSMELGKNKTSSMVLAPMGQLTTYLFDSYKGQEGNIYTPEYMQATYEKLKALAEHNIANNPKEADQYKAGWATVEAEFEKRADGIWGCEYHQGKVKPLFEADKENMAQNAELLKRLEEKCGVENEVYLAINAVYEPWKEVQDSIEAEKNFATLCNYKKGIFREKQAQKAKKVGDAKADELEKEAFSWYEKALEDASTEECPFSNEEKGDLAYRLAYRAYQAGAYSKARTLCYKAAENKKGWGEPYMLIGNMYASSGKRCSGGKGTGWDAQVVAWAATDMWVKAKSIDPGVAGAANKAIGRYQKYYPTGNDIFQRNLKVGASYKVGCWIGATTTIRAAVE